MSTFRPKTEVKEVRQQPQSLRRAERYRYHSTMEQNQDERTSQKSTRNSLLVRLPMTLAGVAVVVSLLYVLWLDVQPRIRFVDDDVNASLLQEESVYAQRAAALLKESPLNRTKLSINTTKIEAQLKGSFPELSQALITIPLTGHRPIIMLKAKQPAFIINASSGPFIVDETGTALIRVTEVPNIGALQLRTITDQSNLEVSEGTRIVNSQTVAFIGELIYQLEQAKQGIEGLTLPAAPNELRLRPEGAGYYVKFDMIRPAREQVGAYLAVKEMLTNDGKDPAEYIDVRVQEKVFYK